MGDAEERCLSSLCMVELVGESQFKCVEYGSSVSYVVNLEGAQCPNFWGNWETCRLCEVFAA